VEILSKSFPYKLCYENLSWTGTRREYKGYFQSICYILVETKIIKELEGSGV
jgi:hypothetical protein